MRTIRSIIVDDEEFAIIDIKEHLLPYPNIELITTYSNGQEGLEGIHKHNPDLIFVDIEMPKLNGFEMLGHLNYSPVIIFVTGFSQYALEGYDYDPADFLLKPIKRKRFDTAISKALHDIETRDLETRLHRQKQQVGYILLDFRDLHGESRKVYVWPEDILFIMPQENNANYIEYHLEDQSVHVVKKTLKQAFNELNSKGFIQVHRRYLVNTQKILELYKNDTLILSGKEKVEIPVSRGFRKSVKQFIQTASLL